MKFPKRLKMRIAENFIFTTDWIGEQYNCVFSDCTKKRWQELIANGITSAPISSNGDFDEIANLKKTYQKSKITIFTHDADRWVHLGYFLDSIVITQMVVSGSGKRRVHFC